MSVNDGGPAFPSEEIESLDTGSRRILLKGMSLRDYFAAAALQGLLASSVNEDGIGSRVANLHEYSYALADEMLAERERAK